VVKSRTFAVTDRLPRTEAKCCKMQYSRRETRHGTPEMGASSSEWGETPGSIQWLGGAGLVAGAGGAAGVASFCDAPGFCARSASRSFCNCAASASVM
jgi:hypothetical protein